MARKLKPCIDCDKLVRSSNRCVPCSIIAKKKPREFYFWLKVDKDGPTMPYMTTPCWVWTGSKNKQGYGNFSTDNTCGKAHRYSYQLHYGEIPYENDICHKCDNPSCVNPEHLFAGTTRDNIIDMEKKGRASHPRGSNHGLTKLKEEDVVKIRNLHKSGNISYKELAKIYGVGKTTIARIVRHECWKHI